MSGIRQRGFTLLEVLVAFTIFALSFAAILQIYGQRLQNAKMSGDYSVALGNAESLLARVGIEEQLTVGDQHGVFENGMQWRRVITAYGAADATALPTVAPFRVDVTVSWGNTEPARRIRLSSLRLSTPQ